MQGAVESFSAWEKKKNIYKKAKTWCCDEAPDNFQIMFPVFLT